jgi:hypothetical protein
MMLKYLIYLLVIILLIAILRRELTKRIENFDVGFGCIDKTNGKIGYEDKSDNNKCKSIDELLQLSGVNSLNVVVKDNSGNFFTDWDVQAKGAGKNQSNTFVPNEDPNLI